MSFQVALSGLNAASADLSVTSNNVANSNTSGFKGSRAEFADVFASGANGVGSGVRLSNVRQQFGQGGINFTDNALDLAISGEGLFVLSDAGSTVYSRMGAFGVGPDGFVENSRGQRLQVYPALSNGAFNTGQLTDLRLTRQENAPQATGTVEMGVNLPADASVIAGAIDPNNPTTFNHSTSTAVYDSLGAVHTATFYFQKTAVNSWDVALYVDGNLAGTEPVAFDATGAITAPAGGIAGPIAYNPGNGAQALSVNLDVNSMTQYGGQFSVNELNPDGFTSGRLSRIEIDDSGVVFARFTNGRSAPLGQVALANFPNNEGLNQLGDTNWGETFASGEAILGVAGTSSYGIVQAGALEASNVDLTKELVNMITAQRAFQANSQVISTQDTITQTIINIR